MNIPLNFIGHWTGEITQTRDNGHLYLYEGELLISEDGVNAVYYLEHGPREGNLIQKQNSREDMVILNDTVVPTWKGILYLSLLDDGKMKCIWRGTRAIDNDCRANMQRSDAPTGLDDASI